MKASLLLIAALVGAASAGNHQPSYGHHNNYKDNYAYAPAEYNYHYEVYEPYPPQHGYGDNSYHGHGNPVKFGAHENRKGDYTKGEYHVLRPDGILQTVDYYVDGYSGFVAKVKEEPYAHNYAPKDGAYHVPVKH